MSDPGSGIGDNGYGFGHSHLHWIKEIGESLYNESYIALEQIAKMTAGLIKSVQLPTARPKIPP